MSAGTRNPTLGAVPGGALADKSTLIAAFYCRRGEAHTQALHQHLYWTLAQTQGSTPDNWHSSDENVFLRRFDPSAAPETTVIQLAFNADGGAAHAWSDLRWRLEDLLSPSWLPKDWWGYTLTYQATLTQDLDADLALHELQPTVRRLYSSKILRPLARAEMYGGKVWLLAVPLREDGLEATTVYVALSSPDSEETFLTKAIYGPDATLLMPDLLAHEGYHLMRQYRGEDLQKRFEERVAEVDKASDKLLISDLARPDSIYFHKLEHAYPHLLTIVSKLKELHISLLRQSYNYDWWWDQIQDNDIVSYHRRYLKLATSEVDLLIKQSQGAMEAVKTALSIAQLQVSKTQASRQWWTATLFAMVGFALGLQGLLDREVLGKLLGLVPLFEPLSGNFLVQLGAQIGIFLTFLVLSVLIVIWINKHRLKWDATARKQAAPGKRAPSVRDEG